jgi:hypothetical protein
MTIFVFGINLYYLHLALAPNTSPSSLGPYTHKRASLLMLSRAQLLQPHYLLYPYRNAINVCVVKTTFSLLLHYFLALSSQQCVAQNPTNAFFQII